MSTVSSPVYVQCANGGCAGAASHCRRTSSSLCWTRRRWLSWNSSGSRMNRSASAAVTSCRLTSKKYPRDGGLLEADVVHFAECIREVAVSFAWVECSIVLPWLLQ